MTVEATPTEQSPLRTRREKLVRDHFENEVKKAWPEVLATFPHPRYELIPTGVIHDGREDVERYYRETRVAFPDQHHEMIALRHADDAVITEFYLLGTHLGPLGPIPPTGAKFKVRMTAYFIFEGDTLVCERIYFDSLTMLKQLLGGFDLKKPSDWARIARTVLGAGRMLL
ncbi:MAG: ester cyclase [Byssovorax sp.]